MQITKAVIPAAGLGTRLRPVTDVLPKELLPVVTKPSLYLVLEEALKSGLKEIILVVSPAKKSFFEHLKEVFPKLAFQFVIQKEPKGLGHAVLMADQAVGPNPFMILLPDIIIDHPKPVCLQLIKVFQKINRSVNATERVPRDQVSLYGVYEMASREG
ncbi:MAG: UTP--glucose-1-phosphate uridylyltransferase, partial [Deltaproteobacteria bacterium]|nr:UTP--glucose-1-phosphate uridylyltransferase [Deltaproteobacteria bacterium]